MSILYEYDEKKQRRLDREEGREIAMVQLVQKKIAKNKTIETIADELETTVDEIRPIYDTVKNFPADANPMEVYSHL